MSWDAMEPLSTDVPDCITWASDGPDGSGKSWHGATAPGPIFVCGFDPHGMSRVDPDIREGKDIRIGRYSYAHLKLPVESDPAKIAEARTKIKLEARAIWDRFVTDYRAALPHIRTCLWDREDLAWGLQRYGRFGGEKNEGSKKGQLDYEDLNTEYVGLIQLAKDHHVNLGLLRGHVEEWVSKFDAQSAGMKRHNTGRLIPDGFRYVADHVDITLSHRWDATQKAYVTRIGKFPSKEWKGEEFADLTFAGMATLAYPSTTAEQWI